MATDVETTVDELKALRREADRLESYRRTMRLGAKHEFRKIGLRDMVFGGGWFTQRAEPLPDGMEDEFYEFLGERASALGKQINERTESLQALGEAH